MIDSVERDQWPPDELKTMPLVLTACFGHDPTIQPGFSIGVAWNKPGIDRRPFLDVRLWRRSINIGWLFDLESDVEDQETE